SANERSHSFASVRSTRLFAAFRTARANPTELERTANLAILATVRAIVQQGSAARAATGTDSYHVSVAVPRKQRRPDHGACPGVNSRISGRLSPGRSSGRAGPERRGEARR